MDLVETRLEGRYISPDGTESSYCAVHRIDPITGHSARITGPRPTDSPPGPRPLPDISAEVERTVGCPFCAGKVEAMTPKFIPAIHADGRFRRGASILFPNISPYGKYSSVCIFSTRHHVPMGDFSTQDYSDALRNCVDFVDAVSAIDPDSGRFRIISQNILPSSGGALLHPHLQVNADCFPMNYHRFLADAEARYRQEHGESLLLDLAAEEERRGQRFIARFRDWAFFAAFAPLAAWEVHAVCLSSGTLDALSGASLRGLVDGILHVQRFWKSTGRNAANMGLFATANGAHPLFLRLMLRSPYRQWYRSDRSAYEVACCENATDAKPETVAEAIRSYRHAG